MTTQATTTNADETWKFIRAYARLDHAAREQLWDLLGDRLHMVSPQAAGQIRDHLGGMNRELDDALDRYETARAVYEDDDADPAIVAPEDACPNCGERRQDKLVWFENADQVQCNSCDHVYAPPRAAGTAGEPRDSARGW
ncbi:MAG: hypothetical protein IPM13_00630 [Phycisphaerales bacterium]|nr:hypothetical protein [Phycisphaerales bacterium]